MHDTIINMRTCQSLLLETCMLSRQANAPVKGDGASEGENGPKN